MDIRGVGPVVDLSAHCAGAWSAAQGIHHFIPCNAAPGISEPIPVQCHLFVTGGCGHAPVGRRRGIENYGIRIGCYVCIAPVVSKPDVHRLGPITDRTSLIGAQTPECGSYNVPLGQDVSPWIEGGLATTLTLPDMGCGVNSVPSSW